VVTMKDVRLLARGAVKFLCEPTFRRNVSFADFSTLKMEAICSSETSVHARTTWRHIPEDSILHIAQ
jgi:hypothetical protein